MQSSIQDVKKKTPREFCAAFHRLIRRRAFALN
jgi:hypothetical protein